MEKNKQIIKGDPQLSSHSHITSTYGSNSNNNSKVDEEEVDDNEEYFELTEEEFNRQLNNKIKNDESNSNIDTNTNNESNFGADTTNAINISSDESDFDNIKINKNVNKRKSKDESKSKSNSKSRISENKRITSKNKTSKLHETINKNTKSTKKADEIEISLDEDDNNKTTTTTTTTTTKATTSSIRTRGTSNSTIDNINNTIKNIIDSDSEESNSEDNKDKSRKRIKNDRKKNYKNNNKYNNNIQNKNNINVNNNLNNSVNNGTTSTDELEWGEIRRVTYYSEFSSEDEDFKKIPPPPPLPPLPPPPPPSPPPKSEKYSNSNQPIPNIHKIIDLYYDPNYPTEPLSPSIENYPKFVYNFNLNVFKTPSTNKSYNNQPPITSLNSIITTTTTTTYIPPPLPPINNDTFAIHLFNVILKDYSNLAVTIVEEQNQSEFDKTLMCEFIKFIVLKIIDNDNDIKSPPRLIPPPLIQVYWQGVMLNKFNYNKLSEVIGNVDIIYKPFDKLDLNIPSKKQDLRSRYLRTLNLYKTRYFINEPNTLIWPPNYLYDVSPIPTSSKPILPQIKKVKSKWDIIPNQTINSKWDVILKTTNNTNYNN